jgi:hypothetical protein
VTSYAAVRVSGLVIGLAGIMTGSALVDAIMAYQPDRAEVRAVNVP